MNTVPPRRYSAEIVDGSPIRRRIHVARSSKACIWISRNSEAAVNSDAGRQLRRCDVSAMLRDAARGPIITTAASGRRCPNTAYDANCVVPQTTIPRTSDVVDLLRR